MWKTFLRCFVLLCMGFGLAWGLFSPALEASWSPVDDHELMAHVGSGGRISFARLRVLLGRDLTGTGRYHPFYDALRSIEVFAWGDQLWLWFVFRIAIFALAVTVALVILTHFFGILLGSSIVFWFFTKDFWADIVARLGPSESYALLGWSLLVLSIFRILQMSASARTRIWWVILLFGTSIAIFSKENMIIACVPLVVLAIDQWCFAKNRSAVSLIAVTFGLIATLIMGYGIQRATQSGVDVYGNAVGISARMQVLRASLYSRRVQLLSVVSLSMLLLCLFARDRQIQRKLYWIFSLFSFSLILHISQFTFYMGNWPTGSRYDFPGILSNLLIASLLVWTSVRLISKMSQKQVARSVLLVALSAGFLFLALRHMGARNIMIHTRNYVEMTEKFAHAMTAIEQTKKNEPNTAIVLESSSINDLELVHAIQVYLRIKHISPYVFLRLHHGPYEDAFAQSLYLSLQKTSTSGTDLIHPISELESASCLAVGLSSKSVSDCTSIGVITGQW